MKVMAKRQLEKALTLHLPTPDFVGLYAAGIGLLLEGVVGFSRSRIVPVRTPPSHGMLTSRPSQHILG